MHDGTRENSNNVNITLNYNVILHYTQSKNLTGKSQQNSTI